MNKSSCCWREMVDIDDIRATSWIISTNGILGITNRFPCSTVHFLLTNQDSSGAWPMFILPPAVTNYSATYATGHALRALYNSLPDIKDSLLARHQCGYSKRCALAAVNYCRQNHIAVERL
ncbi:hypothetical protein LWM68_32020 [Niabella sp. W65]|nr:hypothetical protein [Niabella sp. W65]MCH7366987.1 hypothetical protein [Niabella sp. W65]